MEAVLVIIAALTAGSPIIATVIVSVASRREDSEWTLGEPDVGPIRTFARRIVDFRTDDTDDADDVVWPRPRSYAGARIQRKATTPSREPEPGEDSEPAEAEPGWLLVTR